MALFLDKTADLYSSFKCLLAIVIVMALESGDDTVNLVKGNLGRVVVSANSGHRTRSACACLINHKNQLIRKRFTSPTGDGTSAAY